MQKRLLTVADLAQRLSKTESAIRTQLSRRPDTLPPAIRVPGTRILRWRDEDVDEWVLRHVHVVAPPPTRGRPRSR